MKFGRDICCDLDQALRREWLVTNGLGSFASGTISGILTRRYHGLLVAALNPPAERYLLVSKLDDTVLYHEREYKLFSNNWSDNTVDPLGYINIESFQLEGNIPLWRYAIADAILEKRIWMKQNENTTYINYSLKHASSDLTLKIKALVNYRDYHSLTKASNWQMDIVPLKYGTKIIAFENATPFYIKSDRGKFESAHNWYYGFNLSVEALRGLDHLEDILHAGELTCTLSSNDSLTIALSTEDLEHIDGQTELEKRRSYESEILNKLSSPKLKYRKPLREKIGRLTLAIDQFVVKRQQPSVIEGNTAIAGYHWFGDWGRDTMISLPGLALCTGRPEIAKSILLTFAKYVDRGMLPNRFPDEGQKPEYNTVDATLWFFLAVNSYYQDTKDKEFLRKIFPILKDIIEWHLKGTRYNIKVDAEDSLIYAGQEGVQLTWMDAKVGDWVVTPRIGKCVEINALWYNTLLIMTDFAKILKKSHVAYKSYADKTFIGFKRFWNNDLGYCYDVIDGPDGPDSSLRPNQLFTVSLPISPLTRKQQIMVVEICSRELLTSYGLRSLAPENADYKGIYRGNPSERDGAYHQGTVWGWLLGHFALAHFKVYKDQVKAVEFLEPIFQNLNTHGIGSLSEIFDGDAPHNPKGCIAQAWTVAETLRAYIDISKSDKSG
ncbi:MAG: glycogen debranching protein [Thermodesulfobacteriota bacterium]|nr:MAG: glycogen debranching protein [Thermodesulfobacteriota bacterium]